MSHLSTGPQQHFIIPQEKEIRQFLLKGSQEKTLVIFSMLNILEKY
jgi:hypothetical protein